MDSTCKMMSELMPPYVSVRRSFASASFQTCTGYVSPPWRRKTPVQVLRQHLRVLDSNKLDAVPHTCWMFASYGSVKLYSTWNTQQVYQDDGATRACPADAPMPEAGRGSKRLAPKLMH